MKSIRRHAVGLGALCVLLGFSGCSQVPTRGRIPIEKTHPLPEVAAGDTSFSSYKPAIPYEEMGPSILGRKIFDAAGPAGYRIEVRDLRVDARRKAEDIRLPGASFLEVQSGSGILTMAGNRRELPSGSTFSVPQGQAFTLEATSDQPLTIRARLVKAE
jgi:hypothetical protein